MTKLTKKWIHRYPNAKIYYKENTYDIAAIFDKDSIEIYKDADYGKKVFVFDCLLILKNLKNLTDDDSEIIKDKLGFRGKIGFLNNEIYNIEDGYYTTISKIYNPSCMPTYLTDILTELNYDCHNLINECAIYENEI